MHGIPSTENGFEGLHLILVCHMSLSITNDKKLWRRSSRRPGPTRTGPFRMAVYIPGFKDQLENIAPRYQKVSPSAINCRMTNETSGKPPSLPR